MRAAAVVALFLAAIALPCASAVSACYIRVLGTANYDDEARMAADLWTTFLEITQDADVRTVYHASSNGALGNSATAVAAMIWRCSNPAGENKPTLINFHSHASSVTWFMGRVLPAVFTNAGGAVGAAGTNINLNVFSCTGPDMTNGGHVDAVRDAAPVGHRHGNYRNWLLASLHYPANGHGQIVNMLTQNVGGTMAARILIQEPYTVNQNVHRVAKDTCYSTGGGYAAGGFANTGGALVVSNCVWNVVRALSTNLGERGGTCVPGSGGEPLFTVRPTLVDIATAFPNLNAVIRNVAANTVPLPLGRTGPLATIHSNGAGNLNLVAVELRSHAASMKTGARKLPRRLKQLQPLRNRD
jgi:hypothetical protein